LRAIVVAIVELTNERLAMPSQGLGDGLRVWLFGELRVMRAGQVVALPASKRTRALLGYLLTVAGAKTRSHLCDLLWDGPDDPRAALRWSLTKLRPVVNDSSVLRLEADRERVQLLCIGAHVDARQVADLLAEGPGGAGLQALMDAADLLLRGEFLDGLELPRCYQFHHWCMAERERTGSVRRQVLRALIERLNHDPERALPYAHALVAADPLSEAAHAVLVRVLAEGGRIGDAEAHYTQAGDLLQRELATPLTGELQRTASQWSRRGRGADQSLRAEPSSGRLARPGDASSQSPALFVGHHAGRCKIDDALRSIAEPLNRPMLVFLGEPGIGKTRLLKMLTDNAAAAGARIVSARCFEAEMVRPFGMWLDALRAVPPSLVPERSRQDLAVLRPMPEIAVPADGSRVRLFGAVVDLIDQLSRESPLVVAFDDLQWIDEGSAALLHFLVRTLGPSRTLFVAAVRKDEVDDNPWAKRLFQSLERDCCLDAVSLAPLNREETGALLALGTTEIEIDAAYRESGGNPLFILELAHAKQHGSRTNGQTLNMLIDQRVERLDAATCEALVCAAVIGRAFRPEILGAALGIREEQWVERIERLVRRGLLRPTSEHHFDFSHDLVRQVTYRRLSQPRRRLIHKRIAAAFSVGAELDGSLHDDIVLHAGLAEDYALAARACAAAGSRCLRMFANAEAEAVADRGLFYLQGMSSSAERTRLQIALLNVKVRGAFHIFAAADPANSRLTILLDEIRRAADEAEFMTLPEEAASAHSLIAWLTWRSNKSETTRGATLEAERASRVADDATRCLQLANTGRCLLDVESEIGSARNFLQEAASVAAKLNLRLVEIEWGLGLIARWDGDLERAHAHTDRAVTLARFREDRWREIECMLWLAKIDLERQRYDNVVAHSDAIMRLAQQMGNTPAPAAKALRLLAQQRMSRRSAKRDVDKCVLELRTFDDKASLAYFLNECALFELEHGRTNRAQTHAREALAAARAVQRGTEIAVASAVLARIALHSGDKVGSAHYLAGLTSIGDSQLISARAASQIVLARHPGTYLSTLVQTQSS
jgi:DNA-binding SARP family transcriptional activator